VESAIAFLSLSACDVCRSAATDKRSSLLFPIFTRSGHLSLVDGLQRTGFHPRRGKAYSFTDAELKRSRRRACPRPTRIDGSGLSAPYGQQETGVVLESGVRRGLQLVSAAQSSPPHNALSPHTMPLSGWTSDRQALTGFETLSACLAGTSRAYFKQGADAGRPVAEAPASEQTNQKAKASSAS